MQAPATAREWENKQSVRGAGELPQLLALQIALVAGLSKEAGSGLGGFKGWVPIHSSAGTWAGLGMLHR